MLKSPRKQTPVSEVAASAPGLSAEEHPIEVQGPDAVTRACPWGALPATGQPGTHLALLLLKAPLSSQPPLNFPGHLLKGFPKGFRLLWDLPSPPDWCPCPGTDWEMLGWLSRAGHLGKGISEWAKPAESLCQTPQESTTIPKLIIGLKYFPLVAESISTYRNKRF